MGPVARHSPLLVTPQSVLNLKREEVGTLRNRLQIGLDKLMSTAADVAVLQEELTAMEPKLVATQKDVEVMIIQLESDKATAAETKVCVCVRVWSSGLVPSYSVCVCSPPLRSPWRRRRRRHRRWQRRRARSQRMLSVTSPRRCLPLTPLWPV